MASNFIKIVSFANQYLVLVQVFIFILLLLLVIYLFTNRSVSIYHGRKEITNRMSEIQAALIENETKLRAIVDFSPLGMHFYELSKDNKLIFAG